jgi:hypothetical protein
MDANIKKVKMEQCIDWFVDIIEADTKGKTWNSALNGL